MIIVKIEEKIVCFNLPTVHVHDCHLQRSCLKLHFGGMSIKEKLLKLFCFLTRFQSKRAKKLRILPPYQREGKTLFKLISDPAQAERKGVLNFYYILFFHSHAAIYNTCI